MKSKYIIARYFIKGLKRTAQYYCTNTAQNSHFWAPSDASVKVFADLKQAREAESLAYNEEFMTNIFEWSEALRMPQDKGIWLYTDLENKAQEAGLKNHY